MRLPKKPIKLILSVILKNGQCPFIQTWVCMTLQIVRKESRLAHRISDVNFTNILPAVFVPIFLCQKNYRANLWAHKRCTKHFSTKSCLCLLNVDEIDTWCQLEGLSSYLDKVPFVDPLHWQLVHILCFQGRSFPFIIMDQRFPTWGTRTSS